MLELAHILAKKSQTGVAADDAGGDSFGISCLQLLRGEIGADYYGAAVGYPCVDDVINRRHGKLG